MIEAFIHPHTKLHVPSHEVWVGVPIDGTEKPQRVGEIESALASAGIEPAVAAPADPGDLEAVHDAGMVEFLRTAWTRWMASGYPTDPGQEQVVPYAFPLAKMTSGRAPRRPASIGAEAGMWSMDTMTLIGQGSWEAIVASAGCAIATAASAAAGVHAYALCRPPGHHAGRDFYGGSCYVNNAALAAERLRALGAERVAIIDLDAHHGNGTQEIFYARNDVTFGSVHVDPGHGWFPHFVGYPDERGSDAGVGSNLNLTLPPGSDDDAWLPCVRELADSASACDAIVVSLGVDAAVDDPESPLEVTRDGYRRAGEVVGAAKRPAAVVQEGGYHLPSLGSLVLAFLEGLAESTP